MNGARFCMKKKLVCILGGFYPYFTPNSRIAFNVISELKNEYDVTIIAQNTRFSAEKVTCFDGMRIIRINDYNQMFHSFFGEKITTSNGFKKNFYKLLLLAKQTANYLVRLCRWQSVSRTYIRKVKHTLNEIYKQEGIDVLLPVSEPHEAIIAAVEFQNKHKNIILTPYKLDRFAEGNSLYENKILRKLKYPRHKKTELKTLNSCDALFALPPIANYYYKSDVFLSLKEKVIMTEHPLLKKPEICQNEPTKNNVLSMTYAGSLDTKLRNPEYMLRLLLNVLKENSNMILNLFTFGNCQSILDNFKHDYGNSMYDGGKIPSDILTAKLSNSDFLITIGNNSDDEVPSKLFELLSYGKPIIHFYYSDKDAYINYLSKYPSALLIKMDDSLFETNIAKLKEFCNNNVKSHFLYEEIEKNFIESTPKYVANQFRTFLNKYYVPAHSVIVAHPNQQHSIELAKALKRKNLLHTFITTVYLPKKCFAMRLAKKIMSDSFVRKLELKGNLELDNSYKVFCNPLALFYYALTKYNYRLSCKVYVYLTKIFGVKVAKYAIKSGAKAVIMYDYTAVSCFKYLKKHAPNIIRIIDMSSIPAKKIDNIISFEEAKGFGKYFSNKRMRYTKEYCQYYDKEIQLAHAFLSPSEYIDNSLIECGAQKENIYRASYGVDLDAFVFSEKNPQTKDKIEFAFVGRVEGPKGIFYLLNAFDKIYKLRKDFNLHIIGSNFIEKRNLDEREYITYHGLVSKNQLIDIFKDMHVFVLPSLWEGLSLSCFEAMSSGLCPIISNATGCEHIVTKNDAGLVVDSQNEKSLEQAILHLLENKDLISKYSNNARNSVCSRTWENYYDDVTNAVTKIFSERNNL